MISTGREWLHRVETGPSRFAPLEMPILETGHSPPEATSPCMARISALTLAGRWVEEYPRQCRVEAPQS
jgi:hypothetical protein